ncbi:hypothetical protein BGZ70_008130 [Mortierella alpina]|uniref:Uncharacterized protein n=1 Tax=Mortierella alpina TaxID=64518 RepID=A0A9P6J4S0_MORAP|nr:hypothetical protein BGZ70_008130 [Mortierella alpina]
MTVSNLGVVFAPTLSIGSVLFKALLGGFYNGIDTPANRELGLKIVWGGLLQEMEYNVEEWSEDEDDVATSDQQGWTPSQSAVYNDKEEYQEPDTQEQHETYSEQPHHLIRHQQSMPAISPFSDHYASNTSTYFESSLSQTIVSLDLAGDQKDTLSNGDPFDPPEADNDSDDSEDVELMNAMLLREERAAQAAVPLSPGSADGGSTVDKDALASRTNSRRASHLIVVAMTPIGGTIASSTSTSGRSSGEGYQSSGQSLSSSTAALPSAQVAPSVHVSIEAGTMSFPTVYDGSDPDRVLSSPKSATGAPQLPPIDPVSITL